jgi:hypothetical protein
LIIRQDSLWILGLIFAKKLLFLAQTSRTATPKVSQETDYTLVIFHKNLKPSQLYVISLKSQGCLAIINVSPRLAARIARHPRDSKDGEQSSYYLSKTV